MIACLLAVAVLAPQTYTLIPKESIWVYENASTPADGTFLRAWGTEGRSCPNEGEELAQFSFSYLKWDLSELPATAKLVSAKLELTNIPDPGFTVESAKRWPLEARAITGEFGAKTWTFDRSAKVRPDGSKGGLYGAGYPLSILAGSPVSISIDLKSESFGKAFAAAINSDSHQLSIAMTSAIDPSAEGRASIYKLYGQSESKENLRPALRVIVEKP